MSGRVSIGPRVAVAIVIVAVAIVVVWLRYGPRRITVTEGKFPEELVYVRTSDDIIEGGAMYSPPRNAARPVAIIWIHGWGTNFYYPTYTMIGRELAARGYTTIAANTRMHDLGNVEGERFGKRIRGGGYWGIASDEVRDLEAWVDFASAHGFKRVVLVGHSAGWAAVRRYAFEKQDPRVAGVVLASGTVRAETRAPDPQQFTEAKRLMDEKRPDDLVRIPNRGFPSFISAATFIDNVSVPPELNDFFGMLPQTRSPGVTRIHCPLLAFYAARDVGTESELQQMKAAVQRQPSRPPRIDIVVIPNTDHMYTGEEKRVAETIASWADGLAK